MAALRMNPLPLNNASLVPVESLEGKSRGVIFPGLKVDDAKYDKFTLRAGASGTGPETCT